MSNELICARPGCGNIIKVKSSWNQKYCDAECTRIETNRRIMTKYYDKKDQMSGKTRICEVCNETQLSRYNDTKICSQCEQKEERERNEEFRKMMTDMGILDGD